MKNEYLIDMLRIALGKYHILSDEALHILASKVRQITISKGEKLLEEGQMVKGVYLLSSGLTRSYFIRNGKEVTTWIALEGTPFTNYKSLSRRIPATENIEAIEDSSAFLVLAEDQQYMYDHYPEFNILGRKMAESYFIDYDDRMISMLYASAEDRYKNLMNTQPELFNRVPIKYLASYLDMTPETLSRLRKRTN